jgi:hypothetical protein
MINARSSSFTASHRNPCVGQSSLSRSLGPITGFTSQMSGRTCSSWNP